MALFTKEERSFAQALSDLSYCNPFLPERIDYERKVLGGDFVLTDEAWHKHVDYDGHPPNVHSITTRVTELTQELRKRILDGCGPSAQEMALYEDIVVYMIFYRIEATVIEAVNKAVASQNAKPMRMGVYDEFVNGLKEFLDVPGYDSPSLANPAHLFACLFQVRRAFYHIFENIIGGSMAAAKLRASVWQSIFTHDMRRYRRTLYKRMSDITTLITGPSGTGKELVARAIALSSYIPFDPEKKTFSDPFTKLFHPLNLSALSPTLIESELFGHRRGAFTGALQDRSGWFEVCRPYGSVFLDEVGELDPAIQVKLLRVVQMRTFQRIGDNETRAFRGKIIAATNRDVAEEMRNHNFRHDFFYRLCSDMIVTPSLSEQLSGSQDHLHNLITFVARRVAGPEEADMLVEEVQDWIDNNLGANYQWPGNVRELEQCVRNILVRKEYHPPRSRPTNVFEELSQDLQGGKLSAEELLSAYCTIVYSQTGSYQETASKLNIDRRTVKSRINEKLLARCKGE